MIFAVVSPVVLVKISVLMIANTNFYELSKIDKDQNKVKVCRIAEEKEYLLMINQ